MNGTLPPQQISGWGRYPTGTSQLARPEQVRGITDLVGAHRYVIARGLGRSYGDAAINEAGVTLLLERFNRFLSFDSATGMVRCEAGVTIADLLTHFLPRGFFPPVTPGTRFVTLGGALAADVHGKNHHKDGSFSRHVEEFNLLTAEGGILRCSRQENADVFWATMGGMGLTGIVTEISFRMKRVESAYVSVDYDQAPNLDAALALFENSDQGYTHSVAWIDCLARGRNLGRSVLMRGNWATPSKLHRRQAENPHALPPARGLGVPFDAPRFLLNPASVRLFNSAFYHRHRTRHDVVVPYEPFFYPLDKIRHWNRLYGNRGFLQYQCVLPLGSSRDGMIRMLELLSSEGHASFLAVLKRFGETEGEQLLSFPRPGYTLAVDLPRNGERQDRLLKELDQVVLKAGGRVYLAKDARLSSESFQAMYPELPRWLAIKRRVDPNRRFTSSLSRRLGLDG
ncbi:MAG: FAD-binding oxidoreductase [Gemmatimonadota bacterium]